MNSLIEKYYAVVLHGRRVGTLCQRGDYTRFVMSADYVEDPNRSVLGLRFEENLTAPYSSALRLPKWFSNLLPEGPLREWVADERGVSLDREMELLAQVGHDLPGAVQVLPVESPDDGWEWQESRSSENAQPRHAESSPWRFSLAGVALKFSMLANGDRLTVPAAGELGDWLVKFPDYRHPDVPRNEFAIMSLAKSAGIDVPDVRLIHRDQLEGLPNRMWPNSEEWAYAVRRFDRSVKGDRRIHIEDFAQVRDKYPQEKYMSTFETVAATAYRGQDVKSLHEAVRRIAFHVSVGNGDAHLKNWSLIYRDGRTPALSPAYDLVATAPYAPGGDYEDLGLKFGGTRRFERVGIAVFERLDAALERRFGPSDAHLADVAMETVRKVRDQWEKHMGKVEENPLLQQQIGEWIKESTARFLRK